MFGVNEYLIDSKQRKEKYGKMYNLNVVKLWAKMHDAKTLTRMRADMRYAGCSQSTGIMLQDAINLRKLGYKG